MSLVACSAAVSEIRAKKASKALFDGNFFCNVPTRHEINALPQERICLERQKGWYRVKMKRTTVRERKSIRGREEPRRVEEEKKVSQEIRTKRACCR